MKKYYNLHQVAKIVGVSYNTLNRWYKWYENCDKIPYDLKLPEYECAGNSKLVSSDKLELFADFKFKINTKYRGFMAEFNRKCSGYWRFKK